MDDQPHTRSQMGRTAILALRKPIGERKAPFTLKKQVKLKWGILCFASTLVICLRWYTFQKGFVPTSLLLTSAEDPHWILPLMSPVTLLRGSRHTLLPEPLVRSLQCPPSPQTFGDSPVTRDPRIIVLDLSDGRDLRLNFDRFLVHT